MINFINVILGILLGLSISPFVFSFILASCSENDLEKLFQEIRDARNQFIKHE